MNAPNDHILFEEISKMYYFKNVKTNIVTEKDITSISFIKYGKNI